MLSVGMQVIHCGQISTMYLYGYVSLNFKDMVWHPLSCHVPHGFDSYILIIVIGTYTREIISNHITFLIACLLIHEDIFLWSHVKFIVPCIIL